jgi:2-polyprenyl-3-methyl-5-hydroxy-6-metoxy-1,4-benzoquinol methylase
VALLTPGFDYWLSPLPANRETQLAVLNFVPSYLGLIVSAFALLAVLHPARLPRTGLFFIPALFFTLSLVFGIPPFNLLGQLPILRYSQNFRYIQSFLALSTALASGMGLHLFFTSGAAIHRRTLLGIGLVFSVGILWNLAVFRLQILSSPLLPRLALAAGLALAGLAAVLLAARFLFSVKSRRSLAAVGLTAAAMAELLIYFHLATPLCGPQAYSPAEPPAAAWLRQQPGVFRLLGTDPEALHPNLAGVFGLEDVRDSTPVYTRRYLQLVSALDGLQTPGAILANYFENGRFYLDFDLSRIRPPLLDLLNVRYLLSPKARDRRPLPLDDQTAHGLAPASGQHYLARIEAVINGVRRPALFTHAPSRADLPLPRPRGGALVFDVGVLPEALQNPNQDGVFMLATAQTGAGAILVFSRFLNPRREAGEREWIPLETPLPSAAAALSLLALPGPRDNRQNDFAVWGEPGLRQADPWPTLALVYDRDLRIYENRTARPRAFWVPAAEWLASDEAVLRRLTAKEFDPGQAALIHARPPLPKLDSPAGSAEVELLGHEWGRARVRVSAQGAGFLVLSDLYYPGWEARLDGAEVRLYPVDLALRGLPVPAGEHEVLFRYNPISVHLAVWATLVAYSFAPLLLILHKFFPPKAPRAKESEPAPAEAEAKKAGVCPGCGQSPVRPWLNSVTGLFECRSCGAIFRPLSELPPPEAYYTEDYYFKAWPRSLGRFFHDFDPAAHHKTRFMALQIEQLKKLHPQARVLDAGCSNGVFVWLAGKAGWKAEGIDISAFAVQWGIKQFGVNLRLSRLDQVDETETYDLLSFWDTLEHMRDPFAALRHAHRRLRPGGHLLISTPDQGSLVNLVVNFIHRLTFGASHPLTRRLYHPDHIYFFNRQTLTRLLERAGLEVVSIEGYDEAPEDTETGGLLRTAVAVAQVLARCCGREHQMLLLARRR